MACVKGVSYRVSLNGKKSAVFAPQRGLRQGDPISPYLFIFVADALSALVKNALYRKDLKVLKMSNSYPAISHLFLTDDAVFFY